MKTKIMLLAIGTALLLTACGQVQSSSTETLLPPTPTVREEARQQQATPDPTMTAQEPDAVPVTTQEQSQKENTHQEESAPQTADTPEPVEESTHQEDIPPRPSTPRRDMWSQILHQSLNQHPRHPPLQTVKQPSTLPTPMRSRSTVSLRTQV